MIECKGRPAGSVSFLLIRAYKQVSPRMLEDGREPIPHLGSANASVQAAHTHWIPSEQVVLDKVRNNRIGFDWDTAEDSSAGYCQGWTR